MNIREAAQYAVDQLTPVYDERESQNIIKILFEDLFDISNVQLEKKFLHKDALSKALDRLEKEEPIQYVTGRADFYGHRFKVNRQVLIPRPETEELVHWVVRDFKKDKRALDVLDVGTGSGCIALSLKKAMPHLRLFAMDNSQDALNVARINSRRLQAPCVFYNFDFLESDYWQEMGRFDIIVSNPPYIPRSDRAIMSQNVLAYEPEMALFVDDDPLIFYKAIERFAVRHLRQGGVVYVEVHEDFAAEVADIFDYPDRKVDIRKDLQGRDRMLRIGY